jgi:hypothetical protein
VATLWHLEVERCREFEWKVALPLDKASPSAVWLSEQNGSLPIRGRNSRCCIRGIVTVARLVGSNMTINSPGAEFLQGYIRAWDAIDFLPLEYAADPCGRWRECSI